MRGFLAVGLLMVAVGVAPVAAQGPSAGCDLLNEPQYDGFYGAANTGFQQVAFAAGDELIFAAAEPTGTGTPVERIELREGLISLLPVATEPFPGEIRFPITTARSAVFRWRTAPGLVSNQATWTVSCDAAPYCGDGNLDPGEACDDGNNVNGDGCGATCFLECGNGVVDGSEECDDGNAVDNDDCTNSCTVPFCGDGTLWNQGTGTETCDDGNTVSGDGCDANCQVEAVPTLGEWGVLILALALLTVGWLVLGRRKRSLS
jgi:cysteine-rich repeat protein